MGNLFENPFREDHNIRKPGVAGLVGEFFGEKAKRALEEKIGKDKPASSVPHEDWEGVDIRMSAQEKAKMEAEKEHVRLHDVPTFERLPSRNVIEEDFNLGYAGSDYFKDRPLIEFGLTEDDFDRHDLDTHVREHILEGMDATKEYPRLAKFFGIKDVIQQKKQADPKHPDYLNVKEVLEAIDAAGYRPATLQELLAYSRDHWNQAIEPHVFALCSKYTDHDGVRLIAQLIGDSDNYLLDSIQLREIWFSDSRFLVIRR